MHKVKDSISNVVPTILEHLIQLHGQFSTKSIMLFDFSLVYAIHLYNTLTTSYRTQKQSRNIKMIWKIWKIIIY